MVIVQTTTPKYIWVNKAAIAAGYLLPISPPITPSCPCFTHRLSPSHGRNSTPVIPNSRSFQPTSGGGRHFFPSPASETAHDPIVAL